MRIDLHMHSNISDGTDTPKELLEKAKQAGLDAVAITDHDTVEGWQEATVAAIENQVELVRGMEVTTIYDGVIVHLLAYLFDPTYPKIAEHFLKMRHGRNSRVAEMVRLLSADYPISFSRIIDFAGENAILGRPHIADELVRIGVAENRSEVFRDILYPGSKYYVRNTAPDLLEVISWIVAAGGKTVIAHPKAISRGKVLSDVGIREAAAAGLFGLEVMHRDNPEDERVALRKIATELELAQFGASDYHGSGKPNQLAENTTSEAVYRALLDGTFLPVIKE